MVCSAGKIYMIKLGIILLLFPKPPLYRLSSSNTAGRWISNRLFHLLVRTIKFLSWGSCILPFNFTLHDLFPSSNQISFLSLPATWAPTKHLHALYRHPTRVAFSPSFFPCWLSGQELFSCGGGLVNPGLTFVSVSDEIGQLYKMGEYGNWVWKCVGGFRVREKVKWGR